MANPNRRKYQNICESGDSQWTTHTSFENMFSVLDHNAYLDLRVKRRALRAAPSVVYVKILSGGDEKWCGSGFIIECENTGDGKFQVIIITSASLLRVDATQNSLLDDIKVIVGLPYCEECTGEIQAYDLHYNIAAIKIQVNHSPTIATVKLIDDMTDVGPGNISTVKAKQFELAHCSNLFKSNPGSTLISLGRFHYKSGEGSGIMASPGVYSPKRCRFDCKELLTSTCRITKCGIGGPVINDNVEVIGVNFFDMGFTPFLPINIVFKWWKHCKGEYCRPWLGIASSNLFTVGLDIWENLVQKFPTVKGGIIVDEVAPDSPAVSSGVQPNDIIIKCDGVDITTSLQFFDLIWGKVGKSVELAAIRNGNQLKLSVVVADTNKFNCWPLPRW